MVKTKQSTFRQIGANNHVKHDYEENGFYATDPIAIDKLSNVMQIPSKIWEPMCGQGHLSKRLEDLGHDVYSSDLIDRGYGEQRDFFAFTEVPKGYSNILTNPNFKISTEVIEHALQILPKGGMLILLLKVLALEGQRRFERIYSKFPPKNVYVHSKRVVCAMNGKFTKNSKKISSTTAYAWFVWEKGFRGETVLKWIK